MKLQESIDRRRLDTALSLIQKDEEMGFFLTGQFIDLYGSISFTKIDIFKEKEKFMDIRDNLRMIANCVLNIVTIISKLDYQHNEWVQEKLSNEEWMSFSSLDINYFYIEINSLFDYLAKVIRVIYELPRRHNNYYNTYFSGLRRNVIENEYTDRLGDDLTHLIVSCDWYDDIRRIRNLIIHEVKRTGVFLVQNQIVFQIYGKSRPPPHRKEQILESKAMSNAWTVDFKRYSVLYTGYLFDFLEEFAQIIGKRLGVPLNEHRTKIYDRGLRILKNWIEEFLVQTDG